MSKAYILYKEDIFSVEENVNIVAVFSSYAAMLLWLKEQWNVFTFCSSNGNRFIV